LRRTLARLRPDVVLLHDPFWLPLQVTEQAHRLGAKVVAVHHGSAELDAAGMPGPSALWEPVFRAWLRHAYAPVDAIASVVDPLRDTRRPATFPLRLGVDAAFRPQPGLERGDHVLYVGRLAREKGVFRLLEAAAQSDEPWPLRFVGSGPAKDALRRRTAALGIEDRVACRPYLRDRERLARTYAEAACVVMPGEHETFGMVGLEAAASGARVVACATAPSAALCGSLVHPYPAGDAAALARAIATARAASTRPDEAAALGERYGWDRLFVDELEHLRELVA
jgi:alpha-1,6-mannosyltransferase